jgi:hypothetical protein
MFCLPISDRAHTIANNTTYSELGQCPDDIASTVLDQCSGDHLQSLGDSLVWRTSNSWKHLCLFAKRDRDGHLCSSTSRRENGVEDDISGDRHGVCEISVNLVQDILGRTSEKDRACFWRLAFVQEGKVPICQSGVAACVPD